MATDNYWLNDQGQYHRDDGPAIEYPNGGTKYWLQYDKLHRLDGPAIEYKNGIKYWYYKGIFIDCNSQEEFNKKIKLLAFL